MTWENIGESGDIFMQDDLTDEAGMAQARTFLQKFARTCAEICARFYKVVGETPFGGERQVQSVVLPAMYNVADAVYVEQPITRTRRSTSSHGRIDYWVYYQEYVFLIELKFAWIQMKTPVTLRKDTRQDWEKAHKQLWSISLEEIKESLAKHPNKALRIAMLLAPGYQWFESDIECHYFDQKGAYKLHQALLNGLSPRPNWSCVWAFPQNLQKYEDEDEEEYELYPGLGIMTDVETI